MTKRELKIELEPLNELTNGITKLMESKKRGFIWWLKLIVEILMILAKYLTNEESDN